METTKEYEYKQLINEIIFQLEIQDMHEEVEWIKSKVYEIENNI